jgi:nucleoside-diphosphate-sugar epimerase
MKVFITGASGWIGSAVTAELIAAGHQVIGLARSEKSAQALTAAGAEALRGTVDDLDVLRAGAAQSDGVIHLAFNHDIAFSGGFQTAADSERRAVETFGEALANSGRPLVVASGLLDMLPGRLATEQDGHTGNVTAPTNGPETRRWTAEFTLSLASRGVRSSVVRLAPTNHGEGDNGFMTEIVAVARRKGVSGSIGDGSQRWPAVHRLDSAHLFCLALENAEAGSTLHAVAEEGVTVRDIAEVIGKHLNVPVQSIAPDKASEHFGWIGNFLMIDSPVSSAHTRQSMGWEPKQVGLIEDLDQGHYFTNAG